MLTVQSQQLVLIDPITLQETKYESSLLTLDANGNVIKRSLMI
jgi:hypothetical protein